MRSIPEQRIAEFQEQDYQLYFGISKLEFDRMLKALHEAYRQEHKRKTRFTKISMMDKLILTLIYRYEYRTMESIAKEYEVSLDTIADNIHWVERTLLNADILQTSVTCVYKMTLRENAGLYFLQGESFWKSGNCRSHVVLAVQQ